MACKSKTRLNFIFKVCMSNSMGTWAAWNNWIKVRFWRWNKRSVRKFENYEMNELILVQHHLLVSGCIFVSYLLIHLLLPARDIFQVNIELISDLQIWSISWADISKSTFTRSQCYLELTFINAAPEWYFEKFLAVCNLRSKHIVFLYVIRCNNWWELLTMYTHVKE